MEQIGTSSDLNSCVSAVADDHEIKTGAVEDLSPFCHSLPPPLSVSVSLYFSKLSKPRKAFLFP